MPLAVSKKPLLYIYRITIWFPSQVLMIDDFVQPTENKFADAASRTPLPE
jgi:hypothetical protein